MFRFLTVYSITNCQYSCQYRSVNQKIKVSTASHNLFYALSSVREFAEHFLVLFFVYKRHPHQFCDVSFGRSARLVGAVTAVLVFSHCLSPIPLRGIGTHYNKCRCIPLLLHLLISNYLFLVGLVIVVCSLSYPLWWGRCRPLGLSSPAMLYCCVSSCHVRGRSYLLPFSSLLTRYDKRNNCF